MLLFQKLCFPNRNSKHFNPIDQKKKKVNSRQKKSILLLNFFAILVYGFVLQVMFRSELLSVAEQLEADLYRRACKNCIRAKHKISEAIPDRILKIYSFRKTYEVIMSTRNEWKEEKITRMLNGKIPDRISLRGEPLMRYELSTSLSPLIKLICQHLATFKVNAFTLTPDYNKSINILKQFCIG